MYKEIPVCYQPAYTWLWNTTITKEGIREQIEEMYESGIRAFYIIAEPKQWRPNRRRTYLEPQYLSEEYIELVYYAFQVAEEKGMYTWLYNEGAFPSGMACGEIRKRYPELAQKVLSCEKTVVKANSVYVQPQGCLASFVSEKRIRDGEIFSSDTEVAQYYMRDAVEFTDIQSDNAELKNVEVFLELTHEALKAKFGEHMGKEVTMMFDDESGMGSWTRGLEDLFLERYGYDLREFLPYISEDAEPKTDAQYRAKSDYAMLCGELLNKNYFLPMRKWLNRHNMLSVGHLDKDNSADGPYIKHYGNVMKLFRQFDVPGIDVIWSQISFPEKGISCKEGNSFFPRLASSAARQQGHSKCLSESFAVYGSHVTPEEMRYVVNFQAVRGISLYNFMVVSYDRKSTLCFQFRPSFIKENPGMDCLSQINEYTARLSYLLQESRAEVRSALYYPLRTVAAGGKMGAEACMAFDALGQKLEEEGIVFDIIDEEFAEQAKLTGSVLNGEWVSYENVFVPQMERHIEPLNVLDKLEATGKLYKPCLDRRCKDILARKLLFKDGSEGYFICNTGAETVEETVTLYSDKYACEVDLFTGELTALKYEKVSGTLSVPIKLLRGEGLMIWVTNVAQVGTKKRRDAEIEDSSCTELKDWKACISRRYTIDPYNGPRNIYLTEKFPIEDGLREWENDFSGEVTYTTKLSEISSGKLLLDLGEVRYFAKIYLNDKKVGEITMPPYRIALKDIKEGDELKIVVANTIANVCHNAEFFSVQHPADVGPYHSRMIVHEAKAPAGGLLGPVKLWQIK